eukprot:m.18475 g.18475  ORF g.18475 m.18475 type:complete len:704 (-) comp3345_c0_seq1:79-2190(-)
MTSWSISASPVPLLKRVMQIHSSEPFTVQQMTAVAMNAVRIATIQPIDLNCTESTCWVMTYDPVQQMQLNQIALLMPPNSWISGMSYFANTQLVFPNPTGNSTSTAFAIAYAAQNNIPVHAASCGYPSCTVLTYAAVTQAQIASLQATVGGSVTATQLNESAAVPIPYGWYAGSITISDTIDIYSVLYGAGINDFSNLTCAASALVDSATTCTYLVPHPLDEFTLFNLVAFEGVYISDQVLPISLGLLFQSSLLQTIGDLTNVNQDRFIITSFDEVFGIAAVKILPIPTSDPTAAAVNATLWQFSFTVVLSSISDLNASMVLNEAGFQPVDLNVVGDTVYFSVASYNASLVANLRAHPAVNSSTVTGPVAGFAVLTHTEIATLLTMLSQDNLIKVNVMDRTFWAVPDTTTTFEQGPPPTDASGQGASAGAIVGIIIAILAAVAVVILVAFVVQRRRQNRLKQNPISRVAAYDSPHFAQAAPSTAGDSHGAYATQGSGQAGGEYYHDAKLFQPQSGANDGMMFSNPMYTATAGIVSHYDAASSSTDPVDHYADAQFAVPMGEGYCDVPIFTQGDSYMQVGAQQASYALATDGYIDMAATDMQGYTGSARYFETMGSASGYGGSDVIVTNPYAEGSLAGYSDASLAGYGDTPAHVNPYSGSGYLDTAPRDPAYADRTMIKNMGAPYARYGGDAAAPSAEYSHLSA